MLMGPAFVASIAYVDPGNVAANLSSGARYGYLLVWVLVAANIMAMTIQYQSAKLGIVTGESLAEHIGKSARTTQRRLFWSQAQLVVIATDLAEVVGGAIALKLLFNVPLPLGGLIVGLVSLVILSVQNRQGQRRFEAVVIGLLAIITIGFLTGLFINPPSPEGILGGMVPRFQDSGSVVLAASMLGATVMPHAIYVHSQLAKDRHPNGAAAPGGLARLLKATRVDVVVALFIAGLVNVGMLLLAASTLQGVGVTESIEGAHAAIESYLGPVVATIFAVGLLASGLASTSVGAYAGASITSGLLRVKIPLIPRRLISLVPALIILSLGVDPTGALVISQVVLSFGIPFALIPLIRRTGSASVMGKFRDGLALRVVAIVSTALVISLNVALIYLTLFE